VYGFVTELGPKRLHLLRELVPNTKLIAFIINPSGTNTPFQVNEMLAAAQAVGQDILVVNASNESEIEAAFAIMIERKAGAIIYAANTWFQVISERLVALAARHAIPAMYEWREFVTAGGLISYNTSGGGHSGCLRPRRVGRLCGDPDRSRFLQYRIDSRRRARCRGD